MNADNRNYQVDRSWTLCPSKSFPGKFYYFNVQTGEAAWSLGDIEKKTLTKEYLHRITDKFHGYPEPDTPPSEEGLMRNCPNWYRKPEYPQPQYHPSMTGPVFPHTVKEKEPTFGQSSFPKFTMGQGPQLEPYQNWWSQMPLSQPMQTPPDLKRMPHWEPDRNTFRPKESKCYTNYESQKINEYPFNAAKFCDSSTPLKRPSFEPPSFSFAQKIPKPITEPNLWSMAPRRQPCENTFMPKFPQQTVDDSWKPRYTTQQPIFQRKRTLSESPIFEVENNRRRSLSMSNLKSANVFQNFTAPEKVTNTPSLPTNNFNAVKNFNNFLNPQKTQDAPRMSFSNFNENQSVFKNPFLKCDDKPSLPQADFRCSIDKVDKFLPNGNTQVFNMGAKENKNTESQYEKIIVQVTKDKRVALSKNEKTDHTFGQDFLTRTDNSLQRNKNFDQTINETKSSATSNNILQQNLNARKRISYEIDFSNSIESKRSKMETDKAIGLTNVKKNTFISKDLVQKSCVNTNPEKGTEFSNNSSSILTKDDLRYKLLNRNKCKVNVTATKSVKISNEGEKNNKKKVTFNLGVEDLSEDSIMQEESQDNFNEKEVLTVSMLRNLAHESSKSDKWFVAIDTGVLLNEFEFMEDFVQSDTTCALLIPLAVQMCIESLSQGEGGGRQQVTRARSIARALASPPEYVVLQLSEEDTSPDTTVEDSIMNCCRHYSKEGYHVVLITNSDELLQKAYVNKLYCFSIEEIRSSITAHKQEITFDIQKQPSSSKLIENITKNNDVQKSSIFSNINKGSISNNTVVLNNEKIPVNVARKGLVDNKNTQNMNNHSLFSKNNDVNNTEQHVILQKNSSNPRMLTDDEDFNGNFFLAPKNVIGPYRDVPECDSESTFDLNLRLERCSIRDHSIEEQKKDSNQIQTSNAEVSSSSKEAKEKKIYKAKLKRMKNLNSYTLDEYLKKFIAKNKPSDEMIKTRIEEFVCSFTQILEETLSEVLQENSATQIKSPPWELAEAVEGVKELYADVNSIKIVAEKLSLLLHVCRRDGKLKPSTSEFMRILGCGVILVQCLKAHLPGCTSLAEAVISLSAVVRQVGAPPAPPSPAPPPPTHLHTHGEEQSRSNFIKKPSEIVKYLQKHFPNWREQENEQTENGNTKILRTSGKHVNLLKIDKNKSISMANPNEAQSNTIVKVLQEKANNYVTSSTKNQKETKDIINKDTEKPKETGAKLLRTLALKTNYKKIKPEDIDVEKMDKINKEITSMIDDIFKEKAPNVRSDGSNGYSKPDTGTNPIFNGYNYGTAKVNSFYEKKEITRRIKETDLRQPLKNKVDAINNNNAKKTKLNNVDAINTNNAKSGMTEAKRYNKIDSTNVTSSSRNNLFKDDSKKEYNAIKIVDSIGKSSLKPKIVKPIKDMEDFMKKVKKNFVSFDVQEYSDKNTDDESQRLVINEDYYNSIDDSEDHRLNIAMEADTTNDSGIEMDSTKAYSVARLFLNEFCKTFTRVYKFVDSVLQDFEDDMVNEGKRRKIHVKAKRTYEEVSKVMSILKCIIEREKMHNTLWNLLAQANQADLSDVRMTKYYRVVTKLLEQAQLLCNAVKALLNLTDDSCDISFESFGSYLQYYNIFE